MSITGFGARSLIPDELIEGYGPDPALPDGYLIRPAIPLRGEVQDGGSPAWPNAWQTKVIVHWGFNFTGVREQSNRILIWQEAYDAIYNGIGRVGETPVPNPDFVFRWRPGGSPDGTPWTEIPGEYLGISLNSYESTITSGCREIIAVNFEDRRLNPTDPDYDAGTTALPASGTDIEFFLIGSLPPDEHHPIIIDGMTAGQFVVNAYDGFYSERDPDTGEVIPTGIRYDSTAVLQMTAPVMFALDKPIEDLRDWLEKHIYQPHGFVPALDDEGRISPVSIIPPADTSGLTTLDDSVVEATPEWNQGTLIINSIRFKYRRYYAIQPDPPPRFTGIPRQNVLEYIEIEARFDDPLSQLRFGEQPLEIDALAFGAIGLEPPDELTAQASRPRVTGRGRSTRPVTDQVVVVGGKHIGPLTGDIADEVGYQLALDWWQYGLDRYAFGAPTMRFPVMRSAVAGDRAGSWVWLNISYYPDKDTQRRGLLALAQIIALGEISCPWRRVLVEVPGTVTTS